MESPVAENIWRKNSVRNLPADGTATAGTMMSEIGSKYIYGTGAWRFFKRPLAKILLRPQFLENGRQGFLIMNYELHVFNIIHWGQNKMVAILQTF